MQCLGRTDPMKHQGAKHVALTWSASARSQQRSMPMRS